jgi:hypothetical protein
VLPKDLPFTARFGCFYNDRPVWRVINQAASLDIWSAFRRLPTALENQQFPDHVFGLLPLRGQADLRQVVGKVSRNSVCSISEIFTKMQVNFRGAYSQIGDDVP